MPMGGRSYAGGVADRTQGSDEGDVAHEPDAEADTGVEGGVDAPNEDLDEDLEATGDV
jgi:hypothetical protein